MTLLLLTIYIFNQADRAIFGFLMEPIKRGLTLSDSQLGFAAGPALVVVYAALGVPIARFADRGYRVNVIAAAVVLWSGAVMLSATVREFWQLALARVGVGIGEAGFSAIAQSLIAHYYSRGERTRALALFMLALPLGGVVSSLAGGWINQLYGWRAAFAAAGAPGIVLAVLMKGTVREPRGDPLSAQSTTAAGSVPFRAVLGTLWRQGALRHLAVASALSNTVCAAVLAWVPTLFLRAHSVESGELGTWLAVVGVVGGGAGIMASGYLGGSKGSVGELKRLRLISIAAASVAPAVALVVWCPWTHVALLLLMPAEALMFFFFAPSFGLLQELCAPGTRATMTSLFILIQVLCGGVIGVQLLGVASDYCANLVGDAVLGLRVSMTLTCSLGIWASVQFLRAAPFIRQDIREAADSRTGGELL